MNVHRVEACGYEPVPCLIAAIRELSPLDKLFVLTPRSDFHHLPGQFVQVSLPGLTEAPISISSEPGRNGAIEIGVRRAGLLTAALHRLEPGATLGIRGPFGTGFDVEAMAGKDLLLIAGGCGLLPLRSLLQYCAARRDDFGSIRLLYGAKRPEELLFMDEIEAWRVSKRIECRVTVDGVSGGSCYDGSIGLVTASIAPLSVVPERTVAAIVGPPAMYPNVIAELRRKGLPNNRICVSLERNMRCGVGKCGHCAIDRLYCCTDGPVFWLDALGGLRDAL